MKPGDLVHVTSDNCYLGLGLITAIEDGAFGTENHYRVLTADGRNLFYFPFEITLDRDGDTVGTTPS